MKISEDQKYKGKGKEKMIPIRINTVYITDFNLTDKIRKEKLGVVA